jgi:hypothetical protein
MEAIASALHKARHYSWITFDRFFFEFVIKEAPHLRYLEAFDLVKGSEIPLNNDCGVWMINPGGKNAKSH